MFLPIAFQTLNEKTAAYPWNRNLCISADDCNIEDAKHFA